MKASLLLLLLAVGISAQIKKPEPPAVKPAYESSLQAIVVTTDGWDVNKGTAQLYGRKRSKDAWNVVGKEFPVVIGRSGLGIDGTGDWSEEFAHVTKQEGDGRSPAGLFPLTYAFGRVDIENSKIKFVHLVEHTECVDDVNSNHYNKIVNRMQVGAFDWKSSEKMAEITPEYDLGLFVAYNSYPVIKGRGSCIFLHLWKDANTPTSGCTAMAPRDLDTVVNWLDPKKTPYLVQMPKDVYAHYKSLWKLP
jgi:D-alanyl-D-alanine dipeptidase